MEIVQLGPKAWYDSELGTDCLGYRPEWKRLTRTIRVWDNTTTRTLSFGKETADQAIQQGSARVNNGIQQDIGELATQTSPPSELRAKGRHKPLESGDGSSKSSYLPRECRAAFREKVSESTGIHGVVGIVGRNPRRINATGCKLDLKSPESMASQGIHGVVCQPSANRKNKKNTVKQSSYLTREFRPEFREIGPKTSGIHTTFGSVGGNPCHLCENTLRMDGIHTTYWNPRHLPKSTQNLRANSKM
ncbi:hypothetical protein R3P38DRAFT_3612508 [Favolaschia claudopus]|uniref:Uncharacterized protein n=1 Tax=Favolaschia claudopus TaxID=2862362 RepID=A0AAW0A5U3_9AGAR